MVGKTKEESRKNIQTIVKRQEGIMEKEIQTYASMNKAIKQETARGNALLWIQRVAAIAAVICLILAASLGMRRFIEKAEAASARYGYCLLEDEGIWKKIAVFKEILQGGAYADTHF